MREYCDCGSCCETCGHTNDCTSLEITSRRAHWTQDDHDQATRNQSNHDAYTL